MEQSGTEKLQSEMEMFASLLAEDRSPMSRAAAVSFFRRYYSNDNVRLLLSVLEERGQPGMRAAAQAGRLDAAWAMTNIVCQSSEMCHLVVQHGGVEKLARVAASEPHGSELKMQAFWALGNIAADCTTCKMACRETPVALLLAHSLYENEFAMNKNVVWSTLNIVRGGYPNIPLEAVGMIAMACEKLIHLKKDSPKSQDYVKDCIWLVAQLADDMLNGTHIEVICGMETLLNDIIDILVKGSPLLVHCCLRVLGNIATGTNEQVDRISSHPQLYSILVKYLADDGSLSHEAAWLTSNLAAGSEEQVALLFTDNALFQLVLARLKTGENRLKKECAWTILNMLAGSTEDRHSWLMAAGAMTAFKLILEIDDPRIISRALTSLDTILTDYPHFAALIHKDGYMANLNPWIQQLPDIYPRLQEIRRTIKRHMEDGEDGPCTVYFQ